MSKKRKTKKEKIASEKRKATLQEKQGSQESRFSYTFTGIPEKTTEETIQPHELPNNVSISSPMAQAVMHDIKHTLIASGIVIVINAVLFIFHNQIFSFLVH